MSSIISERGMNLSIFPIVNKSRHPLNNKVYEIRHHITDDLLFSATPNSIWTYNCYKLFDFFSTYIRSKFDNQCLKLIGRQVTSPSDPHLSTLFLLNDPDKVSILENGENNPFTNMYRANFTIYMNELLNHPCLKGLSSGSIEEAINYSSNYMFQTSYGILTKVKNYTDKPIFNYDFRYSNIGKRYNKIFEFKIIDSKVGKDNKHYNKQFEFNFNTIFSSLFLHNIYVGGYSYLPKNFYNLSAYANFLYRKNFLNYSSITTTINTQLTAKTLGITNNNRSELNKKILNIIEELSDYKLLHLTKKIKNLDGFLELTITNKLL